MDERALTRHHTARDIIVRAFRSTFGRAPSLTEAQFAQAIALGESSYGKGWSKNCPDGATSNNWGAVQAGKPPCDPARSFICTDSHPDGTRYDICFRKYATPEDGAAHMIKIAFRPNMMTAAKAGSIEGVSRAMYENRYYTGWGATPEIRIANHVKFLSRSLQTIAQAMGEPMPSESGGMAGAELVWIGILGLGGLILWQTVRA
jgi:hypothetical protein